MYKYKITITYDGTNYGGWQVQPNAPSIQETIEKALTRFIGEKVNVIGSGRTDAGVHAEEQVAHFTTQEEVELFPFLRSANALLPKEIRILSIEPAPQDFHARYSAKRKIYHYYFTTDEVLSPFRRLYCTHLRRKIDLHLLKLAAKQFIGEKDFTSFANSPNEGSVVKNPLRTIYRLDVVEEAQTIRLEFEGNGFLYKMVRNIVGLLFDIASGKRTIEEIEEIFAAKDRRKNSQTAPPQGLFLHKVIY